jgi:hypothetical protein
LVSLPRSVRGAATVSPRNFALKRMVNSCNTRAEDCFKRCATHRRLWNFVDVCGAAVVTLPLSLLGFYAHFRDVAF